MRRMVWCLAACVIPLLSPAEGHAALIQIPAGNLLPDAQVLNFESGTPGPIAGNASLFTNFGLSNVSLVGSYILNSDTYDAGTSGLGLASQNGSLAIVAPNATFDSQNNGSGFAFNVAGTATQFGFLVTDQTNFDITVQTYSNGTLQDSLTVGVNNGFPNSPVYFQSSQPFDEFRVVQSTSSGSGWGLDNLTLAGFVPAAPTPEPATLAVFGLMAAGGAGYVRRRAKATA